MKTPAERGMIGAWAYQARDDAGLSVPQVIEQLSARGSAVTESTIRGIEGGSKKPGRRTLRELASIYGSVPPGEVEEPRDDLAAALNALTAELEAMRQERMAWQKGWVEVLRAYGEGRVPTELLDALAPQPLEDARP